MSKWGRVVTPQFLSDLFNRRFDYFRFYIILLLVLFGKNIMFLDVYVLSRFESVCGIFESGSILVFS